MPHVYRSTVVEGPVAAVWTVVRDFNGLPGWAPFVAESRIEGNARADQVGCVRAMTLKDGGRIRERLLALSDYEFAQTYVIIESPMAVENYVASLRLLPVTDGGRTFAEWTAEFDCPPARAAELASHIGQNVFHAGLQALVARFAGRR